MKYKIIERSSSYELEIAVNAAMEQGWKPIGGICSELLYGVRTVYQAMILGGEDEQKHN